MIDTNTTVARSQELVATGLGNGVTYDAYGFEVAGRIYKGFGANLGLDSAFRARCVAAAVNLKVGIFFEF